MTSLLSSPLHQHGPNYNSLTLPQFHYYLHSMLPPYMLVPSGNDNPPPNVYYNLAFEARAILWKLEIPARISALHGISKTSVTRTLREAEAFHLCCLRTAEISTWRPISQGNLEAPPNWHLLQQSIPRDQFTLLYVEDTEVRG
jgi:hypothetical protein